MAICFICNCVISLDLLNYHFINYHHYGDNQEFKCVEKSCSQRFQNFTLLKRHYLMYHKFSRHTSSQAASSGENLPGKKRSDFSVSHVRQIMHQLLLNKTVQLYGSSDLTRQQIQDFFNSVQNIVKSVLEIFENELVPNYVEVGNSSDIISDINRLSKLVNECFVNFNTEHKRMRLIEDIGCYFPPIEYVVGKKCIPTKNKINASPTESSSKSRAYVFPLRDILKGFFEIPNVYKTVFAYRKQLAAESSVISNFVQSKLWKFQIRQFRSDNILPLFLYYDDFEAGNALGAHAGVNKIGGVYISIPCLPPQYRSSLQTIFNALIFSSKDREEYGNFAVFRPLIEELKYLESQGIELNLSGNKVRIYFKLALILGDNLGLHGILGFVESFQANFACRFCKMNKIQRSLATTEDSFFLRTRTSYEQDLKINDMSLTGIKHKCIFNNLPDFHAVENMSVDIMHDVLEHICPTNMAGIIKYYVKHNIFTLIMLNNRLRSHDFGPIDSDNVPPEIHQEHLKNDNIKMSASEMWTFVRHFGLIVGDLVVEDDLAWRLYLNLRQILALVTATHTRREYSTLLRTLVTEHHSLARDVLERDLRPTDHHLIHYPTVMAASGPLVSIWCMRFESKHQELKKTAVLSSNRINVCKTIAFKQQLKLAYLIHSSRLFSQRIRTGPSRSTRIRTLSLSFDATLEENHQSLNNLVNVHNWVEKNGSHYKSGLVLCIEVDEDSPQFGIIKVIYVTTDDTIFFIYQKLTTIFNTHIDGFKVISVNEKCSLIKYERLVNPHPIGLIEKNGNKFLLVPSYL